MRNLNLSFIQRVPTWFKVSEDSNNMKILSLILPEIELLHKTNKDLYELLDINNATDKLLDIFGKNIGEKRNGQSDDQYRKRILSKFPRLKSKKTHNNVTRIIADELGVSQDKILIFTFENRHLRVEITQSNLSKKQILSLISSAKAHGIIIDEVIQTNPTYPFRFSPNSNIMRDSQFGFNSGKFSSVLQDIF